MKNVLNLLNNIPYMSKADQSFMTLALLIIISIFIGAIIIVGIIKIISVAVKLRKAKKKKNQKDASEYAVLFGGADNIIKTERSLNRILVEVIDRSKVDLEQLKALQIGTQITGNVIKCSSSEMASSLENFKK